MALVVSLVSVCAMSAAVAMVDGTSVVPDSRFAVVEFGEYVASIAFSFATGLLLGGALGRAATKLVRWFISTRAAPHDPLRQRIELARNILTSMAAIGTTIASVVTGLHHLINK